MKNEINCDVIGCEFNKLGCGCQLSGIKITKDHHGFTFCGSFRQKNND